MSDFKTPVVDGLKLERECPSSNSAPTTTPPYHQSATANTLEEALLPKFDVWTNYLEVINSNGLPIALKIVPPPKNIDDAIEIFIPATKNHFYSENRSIGTAALCLVMIDDEYEMGVEAVHKTARLLIKRLGYGDAWKACDTVADKIYSFRQLVQRRTVQYKYNARPIPDPAYAFTYNVLRRVSEMELARTAENYFKIARPIVFEQKMVKAGGPIPLNVIDSLVLKSTDQSLIKRSWKNSETIFQYYESAKLPENKTLVTLKDFQLFAGSVE